MTISCVSSILRQNLRRALHSFACWVPGCERLVASAGKSFPCAQTASATSQASRPKQRLATVLHIHKHPTAQPCLWYSTFTVVVQHCNHPGLSLRPAHSLIAKRHTVTASTPQLHQPPPCERQPATRPPPQTHHQHPPALCALSVPPAPPTLRHDTAAPAIERLHARLDFRLNPSHSEPEHASPHTAHRAEDSWLTWAWTRDDLLSRRRLT